MAMPQWLDCATLGPLGAAEALATALRDGLDPEIGTPRTSAEVPAGELLLMPAAFGPYAGVKVVSVAPGNASLGLPRIHGVYVLLDGTTLVPVALVDGAELTVLRTAAVSAVAIAHLTPQRPLRTVIFGTGPQAWGHVQALLALRPGSTYTIVARDRAKAVSFVDRCQAHGVVAETGQPDDIAGADLVVCATTATRPLFDGGRPPDHACVVAIGSHQPDTREVDPTFVNRARVYVEARAAAPACGELSHVDTARLVNLAELATAPIDLTTPRLFKSVGMAWEDLVVAAAVRHAKNPT
jgi:ornithine cyclodeaminase/alanine dehydrogenase-like protein (mu-crystallin family)